MALTTDEKPRGLDQVFCFQSNVELSNTLTENNVLTLDPINIDYLLYKFLFYQNSSESFSIAKPNTAYSLLKFENLTYMGKPLSLVNSFLTLYENNNNISRNSLSPLKTITLVKSMSEYKSVVDVLPYSVSLSYSDLIKSFVDALVIKPSNSLHDYAEVSMVLSTKIYSDVLKTSVTFNLPFTTSIPGYISLNPTIDVSPKPSPVPIVKPKHVKTDVKYSYEEIHDSLSIGSDVRSVVSIDESKHEKMAETKINLDIEEIRSTDNSVIDQDNSDYAEW